MGSSKYCLSTALFLKATWDLTCDNMKCCSTRTLKIFCVSFLGPENMFLKYFCFNFFGLLRKFLPHTVLTYIFSCCKERKKGYQMMHTQTYQSGETTLADKLPEKRSTFQIFLFSLTWYFQKYALSEWVHGLCSKKWCHI